MSVLANTALCHSFQFIKTSAETAILNSEACQIGSDHGPSQNISAYHCFHSSLSYSVSRQDASGKIDLQPALPNE